MKNVLFLFFTLPYLFFSQNVTIPDANFKAYLVGNDEINTNGDEDIQLSEASTFNGAIICFGLDIFDLKGIESFTNLTELSCGINEITNLDVSHNYALVKLECSVNHLTSLDLRKNTALIELNCMKKSSIIFP